MNENINTNNILIDAIRNNKLSVLSFILYLLGLFMSLILFPRMYGKFVASFPDKLEDVRIKEIILVLSPYLASEILLYMSSMIESNVMPKMELDIVKKIFNKVIESVQTTKTELNTNELILNLKKVFDIRNMYNMFTLYVVPSVIVSIGISYYFIIADLKIGLVVVFILLVAFITLVYMGQTCSELTKDAGKTLDVFCDEMHDVFNNIDPVVVSGMEEHESNRIEVSKDVLYDGCTKKDTCNTRIKFTFAMVYFIIMVVLNGISMKLFFDGKITKAVLVIIFFMVLSLVQSYMMMLSELHDITKSVGNYKELSSYFGKFRIEQQDLQDNMPLDTNSKNSGKIEFKNVTVKYGEKTIFDKLNLTIEGDTKVGIVGKIGSGKTTILKILTDLIKYDGNILIDNFDTKKYSHSALAKHIAYIPQNPKLFNRSILENLSYGSSYSREQVQDTLKYFDLSTFFDQFENKLDTKVGKNGEKLSGGQRQLVYILRSFIQNKKILLLDEPTSSLDTSYKEIIMQLLNKMGNKTIIIVTHDKEIFKMFDRIVVFDKGTIIEDKKNK